MTAVTMGGVLASFGSVLVLEHAAGLRLDVVVEAVVLARVTARVSRRAEPADRIAGLVVLPVAAVVAAEISELMYVRPGIGDSLFVLGMFAAIWVRRFGPHATRAGSLVVAPFVANLILHGQNTPVSDRTAPLWVALSALITYCWVLACQALAAVTGFCEPLRRGAVTRPLARPARNPDNPRRRPAVSTRMALQMAASLGAAFTVGHLVWPAHWTWVVLTAFIVCSGARGRGDVVFKGLMRAVGAAVGTVAGLGIAGLFGPRATGSIVLIFVVLAAATWLRELNYAYWAAGITTVLSLFYGWLGESSGSLLPVRLTGIAIGATVGITASWLLMPVRTRDVMNRRSAEALAVLGVMLGDDWRNPATLERHRTTFTQLTDRLEQIARPLRAHRRLLSRLRPHRNHRADAIDTIRRCARPMDVIIRVAEDENKPREDPEVAQLADAVAANVTAVRRAIARKPGARYRAVTDPGGEIGGTGPDGVNHAGRQLVTALTEIDGMLGELVKVFGHPPRRTVAPTQ